MVTTFETPELVWVDSCLYAHIVRWKAFNIDAEFVMVVDKSRKAQRFILGNTAGHLTHMFATISEYLAGEGYCFVCRKHHAYTPTDVDLRVWSPPCQPYSDMRYKGGPTTSTGKPKDHPSYSITMSDLPEVAERWPAKITMIEQVPSLMKEDKEQGASPFTLLMNDLEQTFGKGHTAAVTLESKFWMEGTRNRTI
jgi:site-specific DNA-cytosine methylase